MRERRNWERVAVTVSSQPLTKTVSVSLGFQVCRLAENRSRVVLLSLEHNALEMCFSQFRD